MKMVPHEAFACPCGEENVVLRESHQPYAREERVHLLATSPGASMTSSYCLRPSTPSSYSSGPSRNAECSNCNILIGKIKVLEQDTGALLVPKRLSWREMTSLPKNYSKETIFFFLNMKVLIIERPRGVYKGWDSKIPNLSGSPAHAPSKGGRDSRVSRESKTGIGCSDKQPSRSSRHRTANIWELQLQLSVFLPLQQTLSGVQWGLTPTYVNSAHAPSKGGRDSRVSRESTTGIGCSDKQPSRSSRHRTANIWELQLQLSASIYGRDHLLHADRSPKLLFSTPRKRNQGMLHPVA
ncbi:hypothetical protein Tco_0150577 [Tanacetum coccineum]